MSFNKTIYMTYKHNHIPDKVFNNWITLNNNYKIEFSLDNECYEFLKTNFNKFIANIFIKLERGAWKADLWRLCKLYTYSGVYSDIDIEPFIILNTLHQDNTFYSCYSIDSEGNHSIFQAFIGCFLNPKHPLLLANILYFLLYPGTHWNWPTHIMYSLFLYNIGPIQPFKYYTISSIKIPVDIGRSYKNTKYIPLHFFPSEIKYTIKLLDGVDLNNFNIQIINHMLVINRLNSNLGWDLDIRCNICLECQPINIYFFKELSKNNNFYIANSSGSVLMNSRYQDYPW